MRAFLRLFLLLVIAAFGAAIANAQKTCTDNDPAITFADGSKACVSEFPLLSRRGVINVSTSLYGGAGYQQLGNTYSDIGSLIRYELGATSGGVRAHAISMSTGADHCPFAVGADASFSHYRSFLMPNALRACNARLKTAALAPDKEQQCACSPLLADRVSPLTRAEFSRLLSAHDAKWLAGNATKTDGSVLTAGTGANSVQAEAARERQRELEQRIAAEARDKQRQVAEEERSKGFVGAKVQASALQAPLPPCLAGQTENCTGTRVAPSGRTFTGEYRDGRFTGKSRDGFTVSSEVGVGKSHMVLTWPDGKKTFAGSWSGNRAQGVLTNADGSRYVGEWNGVRNGRGIEYNADGSISKSGVWKDDRLVSSESLNPSQFLPSANTATPTTSQAQASSEWVLPIDGERSFPEIFYGLEHFPLLGLKVSLELSERPVYAPRDAVVLHSGRLNFASWGYLLRHPDGLISLISSGYDIWSQIYKKPGDTVSAREKIGELKRAPSVGRAVVPLSWEVYRTEGSKFAMGNSLAAIAAPLTGELPVEISTDLINQIRNLPEINVKALLKLGVVRLEEAERGSLRNPEFVMSGTPLIAQPDSKASAADWRSAYLAGEGTYELAMTTGLLLRDVERTQITVKVGDVTRLRIQPNNNTPRGRFETVFLDGQGLRLGEQPSLVVATTPLAAPAAPPTPVASSTPQPDPSALAKEAVDRARDQAERDRLAAEAQRTRAELEARLKSEEEARQKEKLAREQAQRLAQQEQAEREKQQAELQRRLAAEEQARRQMEQKAREEQAERERQQAELQARLKAEEDARRREQQAREQSETRMKQEQAERERLAADNLRLRAELAKAQQALIPANLAYRRAFVVGIDTYKHIAKLVTAREDARAMAAALTAAGFSVSLHLDLGEKDLRAAWRKFVEQVEGGSEVAFFFAGHGVQLGGLNYLIPADVAGESERQLQDDSIPLQRILDDMTDRKAKLTLAVIDACRDNPFRVAGRNVGNAARGLAPTTPATGQMVIFSAGAGQRALDNLGPNDRVRNGVFTRVFVEEMKQRGVAIDKMARNTRTEVVRLARSIGHDQVPAVYDQTIGEFFLLK